MGKSIWWLISGHTCESVCGAFHVLWSEFVGVNMLIRFFVNGQAMSGGSLYGPLVGKKKLDLTQTAAKYRFYSVRDKFPGLYPVEIDGRSIRGELYEIDYKVLREEILPAEPRELELTAIEMLDGSGSLSMRLRESWIDSEGISDISDWGSWRSYLSDM